MLRSAASHLDPERNATETRFSLALDVEFYLLHNGYRNDSSNRHLDFIKSLFITFGLFFLIQKLMRN